MTIPEGLLVAERAANAFIEKSLTPSDRLSIMTTAGDDGVDFMQDRGALLRKINGLVSHARLLFAREYDVQRLRTLDALRVATEKLSAAHGTRILVYFSCGFLVRRQDPEANRVIDAFIDEASRRGVVIHVVDPGALFTRPPSGDANPMEYDNFRWLIGTPLLRIAEGTGGHFFKDTNDLLGSIELAVNPEVTYLLAFNPGKSDGEYHTLKISFKSKREGSIQFRPGYFSPEPRKEEAARAPLDEAVFSKQTLTDVPATVALSAGEPTNGSIPITVRVTVDMKGLRFTTLRDRHVQQLVFLTALLDPHGAFVTGKESIMDLALTDQKLASLQRDGLKAIVTLTAPAGTYQIRTIVREGIQGTLAASTTPIELRAK
jgi:VWFA-related protein